MYKVLFPNVCSSFDVSCLVWLKRFPPPGTLLKLLSDMDPYSILIEYFHSLKQPLTCLLQNAVSHQRHHYILILDPIG